MKRPGSFGHSGLFPTASGRLPLWRLTLSMMDEALFGFLGALIGAVIGSATTLQVQRSAETAESRKGSAETVGKLKVLVGELLPGKWMLAPDQDLGPAMDDLRSIDERWHEIRPTMLSLPILFPREGDLIGEIVTRVQTLSNGIWLFARHTRKGFDTDREFADLERRHTELKASVDQLISRMAKAR